MDRNGVLFQISGTFLLRRLREFSQISGELDLDSISTKCVDRRADRNSHSYRIDFNCPSV